MTQTARSTPGQSTAAATGQPRGAGATHVVGDVEKAVKRDLAEIRKRDKKIADGGLAASALTLARLIDDPKNSATSKSMCQARLQAALDRLHELAPPEESDDRIADINKRAGGKLARPSEAAA